ncbi:MAG: DNA polymerase III subunit delta [Blastocatellia bacterium]
MELSREKLREQIRTGTFAPVYLFYGEEQYLRNLAARTIAQRAIPPGAPREFNEAEFSLNTPDELIAAIETASQLPIMSPRRVVIVRDLKIAANAAGDTLKESWLEGLERYLSDPSPETVLIFLADELNGTRKTTKLLKEKAAAVEFSILSEADLLERLVSAAADAGAAISQTAARHLIELTGPDFRRLSGELEKLITAAIPEKTITHELIDEFVPNRREISSFKLTEHLLSGNRRLALRTLKKILDDGAEPVALIGLISYNYRRLVMLKEMIESGWRPAEAAKSLKLRYSDQNAFIASARRYGRDFLRRAIERIAEVDLAIKTSVGGGGPRGSRLQIELLVCELAVGDESELHG